MTKRSLETGKQGMVATSQPLASKIALDVLKQGGTAVDAAIAANVALGLMEPHMCGVGGDLFAIVWDANTQKLYGLNASGRSPQALSYEILKKQLQEQGYEKIPVEGLLPVSVPGAVDGWFSLHQRFGCLPLSSLFEQVIKYADEGFRLTPVIAGEWNQYSDKPSLSSIGDFHQVYRPDGLAPAEGDLFRNPQLAETYRVILEEGKRGFYEGELAQRIGQFMSEHGGYLSRADLVAHNSEWVDPVSVKYRGYDIFELPPNTTGMAALQMFKLMEGFDLSNRTEPDPESIHLMVEAKKLAFEDRARFYADPDFNPAPIEELLSDEYNDIRRAGISDRAANLVSAGDPLLQRGDTVYLTTADANGNMVSLIQSIFHPFGSGVVVPGTGFALQNRGLLFSMDPSHANVYAPNKRPFQTIIPAFVMHQGKPHMSFGVMGGDMQPQGHAQVISNLLDCNMDLQAAGDALRWRHDDSTQPTDNVGDSLRDGGKLILEKGFPGSFIEELIKRGHKVSDNDGGFGFGGYQAIMCDGKGTYLGASESRKDGCAIGY
jgi:gamma-glutamyltranspeptidase / glutathione hydrolase